MEAMKMEHTIKASKNGKILKIHFKENAQVSAGVELVTLC
jgi:biotin carboxyl carrier protein